ncbi:hypothetical protein FHS44_004644 [Streptosporangium saharense]|uniref:Uncharacterized protein n=1 Tax=Streptosporangium saharense TaxID=1706840 RepID=A0A7W7VP28_9ACTN|nr:hypothetical protein [Streptosporangium saharense]
MTYKVAWTTERPRDIRSGDFQQLKTRDMELPPVNRVIHEGATSGIHAELRITMPDTWK